MENESEKRKGMRSLAYQHAKEAEPFWHEAISYAPKTNLGRRLWAIREKIIASDTPLLNPEEIEQEIDERS